MDDNEKEEAKRCEVEKEKERLVSEYFMMRGHLKIEEDRIHKMVKQHNEEIDRINEIQSKYTDLLAKNDSMLIHRLPKSVFSKNNPTNKRKKPN